MNLRLRLPPCRTTPYRESSRPRLGPLALALGLAVLTACAQLPAQEPVTDARLQELLVRAESDAAALDGVASTPAQQRFVRRVNALEKELTGRPLLPGNRVTLLIDGPATHAAQLAAIAKARHHVHLSVYIFTDDAVAHKYLAAFRTLTRRGVKVRVMVDAMGARGASPEFHKALEDAGVQLEVFGPLNPTEDPEKWQVSHRNHRKILVVDGRVACTGGINISDEYKTSPAASQSSVGWRDTNVLIEGPAVAELQRIFIDSWEAQRGPIEAAPAYFPELPQVGAELVRVVSQDGKDVTGVVLAPLLGLARLGREQDPDHEIYASYLAAMTQAQSRIWITQAYFIPNQAFLDALIGAARRGVDVQLLVPGYTDIPTMLDASRYHYKRLLEAGVHVNEYTKPEAVLHAKTAVIDGVWATVGSSNLDFRSFIHNDEANAIVVGERFAAQMEAMFRHDLETAKPITLEEWRHRPWKQRLKERWAVLWKYWI